MRAAKMASVTTDAIFCAVPISIPEGADLDFARQVPQVVRASAVPGCLTGISQSPVKVRVRGLELDLRVKHLHDRLGVSGLGECLPDREQRCRRCRGFSKNRLLA